MHFADEVIDTGEGIAEARMSATITAYKKKATALTNKVCIRLAHNNQALWASHTI